MKKIAGYALMLTGSVCFLAAIFGAAAGQPLLAVVLMVGTGALAPGADLANS